MDQRIIEYIKKELGKGFSEKDIRQALLAAGHSADAVGEHWNEFLQKEKSYEKGLTQEAAIDEGLARYIRKQLAKGRTKGQIRANLLKAGHTEERIKRHLEHLKEKRAKLEQDVSKEQVQVTQAEQLLEAEINAEILSFISKQKNEGSADHQIRNALKEAGHEAEVVEKHFAHYYYKLKALEQKEQVRLEHLWNNKYVLAFVILIAVILATHYVILPEYKFHNNTDIGPSKQDDAAIGSTKTPPQSTKSPEELRMLAQAYAKGGNYSGVLQTYEALRTQQPYTSNDLVAIADAYISLGQTDQAKTYLEQAAQLHPTHPWEVYTKLAVAEAALGLNTDAETHFQKALALNTTQEVLTEAAKFYLNRHDYVHAEPLLHQAAPTSEVLSGLCSIYQNVPDPSRSIQELQTCVQHNASDINARLVLAQALNSSGDHKAAANQYLAIVNRRPGDAHFASLLAAEYYAAGDYENASLRLATLQDPNTDESMKLCASYFYVKKDLESVDCARRLAQRQNLTAEGFTAMGDTFLAQAAYAPAATLFAKSLEMNVTYRAAYALGQIYEATGRANKAAKSYVLASKYNTTSALLYKSGFLYFQTGNYTGSQRGLELASRIDPYNQHIEYMLARAYLYNGEGNKSVALMRRLIEQNSTHPLYHEHLARAYFFGTLNYRAAIPEYTKYLEMAKNDTVSSYNTTDANAELGISYLFLGDYHNSIKWLEAAKATGKPATSPYFPDLYLGKAYVAVGRTDEAIAEFRASATLNSTCSECYYLAGILLYREGKLDLAVNPLLKASNVSPKSAKINAALGAVYAANDRLDLAKLEFSRAEQNVPASAATDQLPVYIGLGYWYYQNQEYNMSSHFFQLADQLKGLPPTIESDKCSVYFGLALIQLKKGDTDRARQYYDLAVARYPQCSRSSKSGSLLKSILKA